MILYLLRSSLKSLFRSIDKDHSETLDRGHILGLIKEFYGSMPVNMKKYITNPLDCECDVSKVLI